MNNLLQINVELKGACMVWETGDGRRETGDGRQTLSFPPYTAESLARRFPGDTKGYQKILALRTWLVDKVTPKDIDSNGGPAQRTLYRWRDVWEEQGIMGLLSPSSSRLPVRRLDATTVRQILRTINRQTTFALGCLPVAQALLPQQRDPAERGRILARALTETLREIDTDIEQRYGVSNLTTCRFLQRAGVKALGEIAALSERSVYRLLNEALGAVAEGLPTRLEKLTPPAWSVHTDTTKLLGDLDAWQKAGWNIVYARYESQTSDHLYAFVAALHKQLAEIGALETVEPDPCYCFSQQLAIVKAALHSMPIVFVLDNIDADERYLDWTGSSTTLLSPSNSLIFFSNNIFINSDILHTQRLPLMVYNAACHDCR
jgi:hypothetical protein